MPHSAELLELHELISRRLARLNPGLGVWSNPKHLRIGVGLDARRYLMIELYGRGGAALVLADCHTRPRPEGDNWDTERQSVLMCLSAVGGMERLRETLTAWGVAF